MQPAGPVRHITLMIALIAVTEAILAIDFAMVSVALPAIGKAFALRPAVLHWVVSAYSLAFGGLLIVGGRLSDLLGERRCFIVGAGFFAIGALGCALAPSIWLLVAARVVEGAGASVLMPAALSLVGSSFLTQEVRLRAMTIVMIGQCLAASLGHVIGGIAVAEHGWKGIFVLLFMATIGILIGAIFILRRRKKPARSVQAIHWGEAVFVTAGSALLVWSLAAIAAEGLDAPLPQIIGFCVSVVLLVLFALLQRVTTAPIIPLAVLGRPNLLGGIIAGALNAAASAAFLVLVNITLQRGLTLTPIQSGLMLLPYGFGALVTGFVVRRLSGRFAARPRVGLTVSLLMVAGCALFLSFLTTASPLAFVAPIFLVGVGTVIGLSVAASESYRGVQPGENGIAAGLVHMARIIAIAIGVSIALSALHVPFLSAAGAIPLQTFSLSYRLAALYCFIGVLVVQMLIRSGAEMGRAPVISVSEPQ